jgi:hypothetical protein
VFRSSPAPDAQPTSYGTTVKGSGIATGFAETHMIFFQHSSGQIRYLEDVSKDEDSWIGGKVKYVVANDAKSPTPIAVDAVTINNVTTVRIVHCLDLITKTY